jgi:glutamine cyclotransferase
MAKKPPPTTAQPTTVTPIRRLSPWLLVISILIVGSLGAYLALNSAHTARQPDAAVPASATAEAGTAGTPPADAPAGLLSVQILHKYPHDTGAFTEGLLWDNGRMFESTGLEGQSTVREVELTTGKVLRKHDLPAAVFGEGLALVGDRLTQLTWRNQVAFNWARDTFAPQGEFQYTNEGWGLCPDGNRLVQSDGSDKLTFRDPTTFKVTGQLPVTLDGTPVTNINELECVGDDIYANIWMTDWIYRIDKTTGHVRDRINAAGLLTPDERSAADVLNGIAWRPETSTFLITGKNWPWLFEVHFVGGTAAIPLAETPGGTGAVK